MGSLVVLGLLVNPLIARSTFRCRRRGWQVLCTETKNASCVRGGDIASAMRLVPYLAEISAGVGTLRDCSRRLPGFIGPIPSTALDKAIQLLQAIVGWAGFGVKMLTEERSANQAEH